MYWSIIWRTLLVLGQCFLIWYYISSEYKEYKAKRNANKLANRMEALTIRCPVCLVQPFEMCIFTETRTGLHPLHIERYQIVKGTK